MTDSGRNELQYGVDRLVISGTRVFGWGWAADRTRAIESVELVASGEGWERRLRANFGLGRSDVRESFPDLVNAGSSGFVVTGFLPGDATRGLAFEVVFEDGGRTTIDATCVAETRYEQRRKRRLLAWIAQAVWRRLKQGDIAGIVRRAKAQSYGSPSLDDMGIVAQVLPALGKEREVCLVFDHNMGGGANLYRQRQVAERLAVGRYVLLCTYNLPTLDYRLQVLRPGEDERLFRISTFLAFEAVLREANVVEIFLNSPVSFDEPLVLAEWLARMRAEHAATRLVVTAHDYFAVCPSFVLLDADGRYCGIPDVSACATCLKRHTASYVQLSPPTQIGPWRALWSRCLHAADEIRCFSESTRRHLLKAYPGLDHERLTVVPHALDYSPPRLPQLDHRAPLTIGIVGHISAQKGARIVAKMVDLIDRDHPDVRVVVLGTLDAAHKSPRLVVTGPYDRAGLVDRIEAHRINLFLFPSICPETFSYVVEELACLKVPIVSFDLGAPAERLRGYPDARLCEVGAAAALATLLQFHRELARGGPTARVIHAA